ncbi:serine-rich adhesin for platelets isoform X1 [Anastrepha ludens]|uniref:serine-rich adhesin for platelets isoform X1 n=1 Tax=Anastrepha ludens TaxID=28586 RepID=UPI0023B0509F|nr:serine-rich adhesin for platelets isoform X1 [Anastrepha ludens]XP_053960891.1 serine-rich adhesin for platelets isoform X1 [Anastrepha ludens]XP_053960892.1 serine-rich adhesin for platelets isoform X1 [Anastrepha ludens]XP_053960893.1 serine-rich adhesin for platelets isoform X1 [Anastrepha ludens]XP_053960894.1 serine-rich adhesin for platelets isoform X1 [Anastrepha ludens]XP_053960895.1 serine-rich adhesin for platelets isoform X1 [Anastrepha ludens]XP_053960896.1 serine-rich adhesin 
MANTLSVMTNVLRNVVSKQRIRYKENGYNLDLAYICDNIIAMGYPADNIESIFRNRLEDVYKFLQEIHQNHYKIYNLCLERSYDSNKFHGRVAVYPFEDHNPPTIELIQRFCTDVDTWLKADSQNVAAVHCKAGKGRTGTMICCYLLYSGQQATAEDALECYAEKRTKDRKGVTIPSQRRYVQYFAKLIRSGVPYEKRILQFCEIRFTEANLLHSHGTVHCSISVLEDNGCSVKVMPLLGLPIDFRKSYTLDLKNHSLCVAGDIKVELTHKKKLFHFWFNTYFVRDDAVIEEEGEEAKLVYTLNKCEIDDAHKDKEHKCFSEGFKVQLVFFAENSMRPGLQANVSSIASQISNNQRKSQNARLSHQYSGGGGDSSSSSNYQLPQNSSSGSDLNYICDQKSSSSASASVSSLGGPLAGGVGSGSIGDTSLGDTANTDFSRINVSSAGSQFIQHPHQQQQNQRISVGNMQQRITVKNMSGGGCDGYDCDEGTLPFGRISAAASTAAYALHPHQQHSHQQHTYVNLENILSTADKQHLQLMQQHQLKPLTTPNHATASAAAVPATATNSFMLATAIQQQNSMKFVASSSVSGLPEYTGKNMLQHKAALEMGSNTNNSGSSRQLDGEITTITQRNGTVCSSGGAANGCISGNSSKSSISSQSSSSASTTSSSSSAPTSAGDQDCEEEDWESGECHPKMSHTIAHKALQLSPLLVPSNPPTANNTITFSDITILPTTTTSTIQTSIPSTITTHSKPISTPISQLPSTYFMNINSNSGSYKCSYCCCDDDEINPNLKCECENFQQTEKLENFKSISTNERRSSCTAAKRSGDIESVSRSVDVEDRSTTEFKSAIAATGIPVAANKSATTVSHNSVTRTATEWTYYENPQYQQLVGRCDKALHLQMSILVPKKCDDAVINSKSSHMSNVGNVVSSWTSKPLFQHRLGVKKMRDLGVASSAAIAVTKSNAYGPSSTPAAGDAAVLALSCSPASGCSGLASTSRRKLKNKLKSNTKKLSHWLQNHFRANPVEFCENVVQHTMAMRRNSNCSVSSRSHKLSMSSTSMTVTPASSLPKRQLLVPSKLISEKCIVGNEVEDVETYDIYDGEVEQPFKDDSLSAVSITTVNMQTVGSNGRTKISLSESTTASNASLSTVGGSAELSGGRRGGSRSSDVFEDFYSSNCDNQLSFNNSPCKSPRSLVDIAGSSAYSAPHELVCATSLNERNAHLQMKRELQMQRNLNALSSEQQQHHPHHHHLHQLNVVVVAAKPAKTHAIGFNVTNERTQIPETFIYAPENNIDAEGDNKDVNHTNASDMTIGANVTVVTTVEEVIKPREKFNICQGTSNGNDMLDTKIDEVDEDEEDGATTASSIYYTPTLKGMGIDEIDGIKITQKPFVFPNMQEELANICYSDCHKAKATTNNVNHSNRTDSNQNSAYGSKTMMLEKGRQAECIANEKHNSEPTISLLSPAGIYQPATPVSTVACDFSNNVENSKH